MIMIDCVQYLYPRKTFLAFFRQAFSLIFHRRKSLPLFDVGLGYGINPEIGHSLSLGFGLTFSLGFGVSLSLGLV